MRVVLFVTPGWLVFKKYPQMKLQMKREALEKINRQASEAKGLIRSRCTEQGFDTVLIRFEVESGLRNATQMGSGLE